MPDEIRIMQEFIREFSPFFYDEGFDHWTYEDYKSEIRDIVENW